MLYGVVLLCFFRLYNSWTDSVIMNSAIKFWIFTFSFLVHVGQEVQCGHKLFVFVVSIEFILLLICTSFLLYQEIVYYIRYRLLTTKLSFVNVNVKCLHTPIFVGLLTFGCLYVCIIYQVSCVICLLCCMLTLC